jgi:3-methyladenine DNA glycosylase/8-oxoguanine DNA glycosylase
MSEPSTAPLTAESHPAHEMTVSWLPGRPVDVVRTLGPLRRGSGDPAFQLGADGTCWWSTRTPLGAGTLAIRTRRGASAPDEHPEIEGRAWGPGAAWLLERLPILLGADDAWEPLDLAAYPRLGEVARRHPGLRLPSSGRLVEAVVAAALEQRVTGKEARQSWRQLLHKFGTPAPGPRPGLFTPPDAVTLLDIPTWDWHRLGVEAARQRPIRAAATAISRLERCDRTTVLTVLTALPGIGPWTAAEAAQRAFGHPDAVSVGDYHVHDLVVYALTGRPRGTDAEMLELLAPWVGQRHRVVRLIELSTVRKPRFGPRYSPIDFRRS